MEKLNAPANIQSFQSALGSGMIGANAATLLASGARMHELRANATLLQKDEWKELDNTVLDVARTTLVGIADLIGLGLVHQLGGLGTLISEYERIIDMDDAELSMDVETVLGEDTPAFDLVGVPVPVISKGFRLSLRRLLASRRRGDDLETTSARIATRKVRDKSEELLFKGSTKKIDGNAIYGYTTHPNRNTLDASTVPGVTNAGDFGSDILNAQKVINEAIRVAEDDNFGGPYGLYIANQQLSEMRVRYTDGGGSNPFTEILQMYPQLRFIKRSDMLASGQAVLVQLTEDVVDLAIAEDIQTVDWSVMGGMVEHFKVMAVWVPRIKADTGGRSGLVHISGI